MPVEQTEGTLFTGSGALLHFGRTTSTVAVHQAINFFPARWLVDGLPLCLELLVLFQTILPRHDALGAQQDSPWRALASLVPADALAHAHVLVHPQWAVHFFSFLAADVALFVRGGASRIAYCDDRAGAAQRDDPHTVSRAQLAGARAQLDECLALLHSDELRAFYQRCDPRLAGWWPAAGTCKRART